jgi:hypothetical protein
VDEIDEDSRNYYPGNKKTQYASPEGFFGWLIAVAATIS